ncbi:MAG TPA: cytochrome c3 family protein, partial [Thermoanaerobaculia bacterium]|nr:cytochrome c3 family protein [Thermoanaerobaculia bacterium]
RAQAGCLDCHKPWEGPVQARCAECHARPDHQPTQARTPDCSECHFEHRGTESLTRVDDGSCVSCHGNLTVRGGGEPRVARSIRAFPEAHADFRVAKTDPAVLRFGHRKHLEKPVLTPEGERVRLECESCHVAAAGASPTEMRPVDYETACASCHLLTFDPALADEAAPHGDPRRVREFLIAVYSDRRDQALSIREIRRRILREPEARPVIDLSARASRAVVEAERYLYGTACRECHEVDLEARPVPAVTPPGIPAGWLAAIPFPHDRHLRIAELACTDCHTTAAGSRETSDVLIPGIAFCGGCHGGNGKPPGKAAIRPGPLGCRGCHDYHPEDMG